MTFPYMIGFASIIGVVLSQQSSSFEWLNVPALAVLSGVVMWLLRDRSDLSKRREEDHKSEMERRSKDHNSEIERIQKIIEASNVQGKATADAISSLSGKIDELKAVLEKSNERVGKLHEEIRDISRGRLSAKERE